MPASENGCTGSRRWPSTSVGVWNVAPLVAVRRDAPEEQALQQRAAGPGFLADEVEHHVAVVRQQRAAAPRASPRASSFITGSPNVSATSSGVNASALPEQRVVEHRHLDHHPAQPLGRGEATSSAVLAPSEVPITTACSISQVVHQRDHLLAEEAPSSSATCRAGDRSGRGRAGRP